MIVVLYDNQVEAMNTTIAEAETLTDTSLPQSAPFQYKMILVPHDGSTMAIML